MLTQKDPEKSTISTTLMFPPSLNQTYRPSTGNAWPTWHRKLANMFNVMSFSKAETAGAPTSSKVSKAVPICQSWSQIRMVRAIVERLDEVCTCLAVQTSESVKVSFQARTFSFSWYEMICDFKILHGRYPDARYISLYPPSKWHMTSKTFHIIWWR